MDKVQTNKEYLQDKGLVEVAIGFSMAIHQMAEGGHEKAIAVRDSLIAAKIAPLDLSEYIVVMGSLAKFAIQIDRQYTYDEVVEIIARAATYISAMPVLLSAEGKD